MAYSENEKIREVQKVALELLTLVQEKCESKGIKMYLRGGSVMGAVKYQGFVPWDDDTDIAIPRPNYNDFIDLFPKEWSDKYWLATYKRGDAIHAYFPRFLLTEDYRKKLNLPKNNHLGFTILDVLPIDGVPNNKFLRSMFTTEVYFYRLLGALHTASISDTISQHKGLKKIIITSLNKLKIQKLYTQESTFEKLDKIYMSNDLKSSKWSGTITGSSLAKELFPSEVWGSGVTLPFEDKAFRVPTLYDSYLKHIYGDNYADETPTVKKAHFKR